MTKATRQMEKNRDAGDPAMHDADGFSNAGKMIAPAGIDHDGVPIELTDRVDPDTGEIFTDPENQMVKHPASGAPAKRNGNYQRVSDVIESGFDEFHPDAERITIDQAITAGDVLILDCVIVENFETQFGVHTLAIVAISHTLGLTTGVDGAIYTFPTSGQVVVAKLRQLKAKGALPIIGRFVKDRRYYDLK